MSKSTEKNHKKFPHVSKMVFVRLVAKRITRIRYIFSVLHCAKAGPSGRGITTTKVVSREILIFAYHSISLENVMKSNIFYSNLLYKYHLSHDS